LGTLHSHCIESRRSGEVAQPAQNLENTSQFPDAYPERLRDAQMNFNLALDVALGVDEDSILEAYQLQHHELKAVQQTVVFQITLRKVKEDLAQNGASFKVKAQAQAEVLLAEAFRMAMNPDVAASVRADLIKQNVRWAGFDNPNPEGARNNDGFTININLGGGHPSDHARVVSSEDHSAEVPHNQERHNG